MDNESEWDTLALNTSQKISTNILEWNDMVRETQNDG